MVMATTPKGAEEKERSASQWEGVCKVGLSLTVAPVVAIGATALTVIAIGASAVTKTLELGARLVLPKSWGQDTLQKWSKQSRSVAANSFFTAISYTLPVIPLVEGCANMYTGRRNFGMAAAGRWAARGLSGGWFGGEGVPQTEFEEFTRQQVFKKEQQQELETQPKQQSQTPTQGAAVTTSQSKEKSQSSPALDIAIDEIKKALNYTKAQEIYTESLNKSKSKKFDVAEGFPKKDGENTIIVFDHPEHKGDKNHQVTYTIGKDGKPISIVPGKEATCTLPPIEKGAGDFEMVRLNKGQPENVHNSNEDIKIEVIKPTKAEVVIAKPRARDSIPVQPLPDNRPKAIKQQAAL